METSFHQDLNGDGAIGVPNGTVIESFGSTSLVQVGSNYFFDPVAGGTGPELKYNGSPVVAGQFDPYAPVGVEQTASGYEVAFKNAGTNQFSIWNTDSNGNFLSISRCTRNQRGAGIVGDQLPPGPQWRRRDR